MAKSATLKVPALHCGNCANTVTRILEALPSVKVTEADRETKLVSVQYDEPAISLDQIRDALDEVGFSPED